MVMAMIRISGLAALLAGSALFVGVTGCDSGGSTGTPTSTTTSTGTGTGAGTSTVTGTVSSTSVNTGTNTGTKTSTVTSVVTSTGVSTGTGTTTSTGCGSATVPTATGSLSVAAGYVTVGTLKGYGFTWKGDSSNAATCITPTCNTLGCTPAFGATAVCGAGTVGADTTYNSITGIGMNLNQPSAGGTPGTVVVNTGVTVGANITAGLDTARVQVVGGGSNYCAEAGTWAPGTAIPVASFNTACWEPATGTAQAAGTAIESVHIVFPSSGTADRPFSACLTNVAVQ